MEKEGVLTIAILVLGVFAGVLGDSLILLSILDILIIILAIVIAKKHNICEFKLSFLTLKNCKIIIFLFLLSSLISHVYIYWLEYSGLIGSINEKFLLYGPFIYVIIRGVVLSPIVEELIFRGVIIGKIFKNKPYIGIIVSSITFGFAHIGKGLVIVPMHIIGGLILSIAYFKTKRLEVPIIIHALINLL
ncbi:CPBP family intramembrane metalloprotease [Clostridioides mangenotii]|uniref:CPBP family intramembrane glutamic endopeptidase n=1 Tax=Metaclostridioides mangenotii TaxID=1540 RepID=UPI00214A4DD3|nr:type II CAAX endopeptidase family protein [Clostridioides mangenotii]MCR1955743.1 CPBP family intramembrane metalloprotease [Clostridioides mangenotii]